MLLYPFCRVQGLLPKYPTLGPWLMSKHVALDVLGEQLALLHTIEAAGVLQDTVKPLSTAPL
jgi:hypothetical protein